ncbi:hypothetical protein PORCRE_727 [Porphyromonas crevioricanis JCM 15906]|uniref:Uncharacterized protein n=1 Tax=Porphyromonas crevioricanis JCM 15906 TaxID=1305617 RepID=T1DR04_9PORP|nr:hypothetical protein PORCRE_727 [Porphyromonas crevioricanis JCM 15906]GAD08161.1 hypothetical protein PORCAN_1797 [Porphyromonas crevioricanis JCM 13913]
MYSFLAFVIPPIKVIQKPEGYKAAHLTAVSHPYVQRKRTRRLFKAYNRINHRQDLQQIRKKAA